MNALRTHAVILPGQPLEDFAGSIGGSIIDDNDFEPRVALPKQVANRVFNPRFLHHAQPR